MVWLRQWKYFVEALNCKYELPYVELLTGQDVVLNNSTGFLILILLLAVYCTATSYRYESVVVNPAICNNMNIPTRVVGDRT